MLHKSAELFLQRNGALQGPSSVPTAPSGVLAKQQNHCVGAAVMSADWRLEFHWAQDRALSSSPKWPPVALACGFYLVVDVCKLCACAP